jgi:hypothetical protein
MKIVNLDIVSFKIQANKHASVKRRVEQFVA